MKFITYQSEAMALLLALPDWSTPITVEVSIPDDQETGLSGLVSARSFAESPRLTLAFKTYLASAADSTTLRLWLMQLQGQTMAVPMWTDQTEMANAIASGATSITKTADNPVFSGASWIILSADASTYEIVTVNSIVGNTITLAAGTSNAWPAGTMMYPLLFGKFHERPKAEAITDETLTAQFKIDENSSYARRLNPFAGAIPTVGSGIASFSALPLFDIQPSWEKPLDTTEVDIIYKQIGFLRQEQQQVYGNPVRRGTELTFYQASRAEIAKLARIYVDRRGRTRPFMTPTWKGDLRLTQDLPVGSNARLVPVEPTKFTDPGRPLNPGDYYFAFVGSDGSVDCQQLTFIDFDGLHMVSAIVASHPFMTTKLSHLLLTRFADKKLTLSYDTDGKATAKVKVIEAPNEYTGIVSLPEPVFLYRFTHQLSAPQYSRFTSYENTFVTNTSETFLPGPFSHGSLKLSAKLDQEKLELESFNFSGNPLGLFIPFALEAKLIVDVLEADALNPSTPPKVIFSGRVAEVDAAGNEWKAICQAFGGVLERPFPNFFVQKVCNYVVYTPAPCCGVDKNAFKSVGTIAAIATRTIDVTSSGANTLEAAAAALTPPQQYFALGFIEVGSGATFEQRMILNSIAITGGVRLVLDSPLRNAIVSSSINMYPGCDGAHDTCLNKFANLSRFGGHAFVPDVNPTIKAMTAKTVSPGKK